MGLLAGKGIAQERPCGSDEAHRRILATHPEIAEFEAQLNSQLPGAIKKLDVGKVALRTTADQTDSANFWYDIPIVVHIVHDYGNEYLKDDDIFNDLVGWNKTYGGGDPDTGSVIVPFKPYVGNPHIRLHLAQVDPSGNPSKGITRHRSYLATNGSDQAKLDDWDPTSYVNIWFIHNMSAANGQAAAYAYYPSVGAELPYYDGIIALYNYAANVSDYAKTINHEMGHVLNLKHPWGDTNNPSVACGDDDVDDTPPTEGHSETGCTTTSLYDTVCANNYYKVYSTATGDSLVNYPDTVNAENIMDYTYCAKMFTKGQVYRMRQALNSPVADRINLWSSRNLYFTGIIKDSSVNWQSYTFLPRPDLKPRPEFNSLVNTVSGAGGTMQYFTMPGTPLTFVNKSWNDTVTEVKWDFSSGGANPDSIANPSYSSYKTFTFTQPGWVNVNMSATGNHTGDTTVTYNNAIYVADASGIPGETYYEEFDPANASDAKWVTFNYYNNEFSWKPANVGYWDNHSIEYHSYDNRINPAIGVYPFIGSPYGDFDDLFSAPIDLSSFTSGGVCNLNFMYSSASRTSNSADVNDSMVISYSTNAKTWTKLTTLKKSSLLSKGSTATEYVPSGASDWSAKSIALPAGALNSYVLFRFRYFPGADASGIYSTGNNFYMDRVNFSKYTAEVSSVVSGGDVTIAPNPTSNNAYVIIRSANNSSANIVVTDIAGRTTFTATQELTNGLTRIEIPSGALTVKGMYLVQVTTNGQSSTQKLVVY